MYVINHQKIGLDSLYKIAIGQNRGKGQATNLPLIMRITSLNKQHHSSVIHF